LQRYYPDAQLVVNKYLADIPYRKKKDDVKMIVQDIALKRRNK